MNRNLIWLNLCVICFLIVTLEVRDAESKAQVMQSNGATVITIPGGKKKSYEKADAHEEEA